MDGKEQRLDDMRDILAQQTVVTIKDFASRLGISEMTVRRDVSLLKNQGIVDVFYGGVSLKKQMNSEGAGYQIDKELGENAAKKMRIAAKAASLIVPNDVLLIDTGSTTSAIVDQIPASSQNIVYCYALGIANGVCAKPNLKVVLCGGIYHPNTGMFESEEGAALISRTKINKAFMAARGVTASVGVTTAENYETDMKQAAMAASEQKILLADSAKMGKAWYARYAALEDFDMVITDSDILDEHAKMIENAGVELCVV